MPLFSHAAAAIVDFRLRRHHAYAIIILMPNVDWLAFVTLIIVLLIFAEMLCRQMMPSIFICVAVHIVIFLSMSRLLAAADCHAAASVAIDYFHPCHYYDTPRYALFRPLLIYVTIRHAARG